MIDRIEISNFKSYRKAAFPLSRVTILLGANASGKSNALEAIRFLHWMGRGDRLDDVAARMGALHGQIRGGISELFHFGKTDFEFRVLASNGRNYTFVQKIAAVNRPTGENKVDNVVVGSESCKSDEDSLPLYILRPVPKVRYSDEVEVECNNFARGGKKPHLPCSNRQSIFLQLQSPARFDRATAKKRIPEAAVFLKNTFGQMVFLSPEFEKMRGYSRKTAEKTLAEDASNISSVVYNLCRNPATKEALLGIVRSLPEQDIRDITFVETALGDVMLQLEEGGGAGRAIPATLLSDGTLKILAFAACILTMPSGTLGVIEEIDNGIHPSRVRHLVEKMFEFTDSRNTQLLVTTHNPALMSAIPDREIPNVLYCFRNSRNGSSEVCRLGDIPRYLDLVSRGALGDLAQNGVLGKFMQDKRSPEEITKRNREWFEKYFGTERGKE